MRSACEPFVRIVNSSRLFIATVGAGPSRMRGVCGVIATARNGDVLRAGLGSCSWHSSHVPFTAR